MFVAILLHDLARDFRVEFSKLAPSRDFHSRFSRGQKTIGSHLKFEMICIDYFHFLLSLFIAGPSAQTRIDPRFVRQIASGKIWGRGGGG